MKRVDRRFIKDLYRMKSSRGPLNAALMDLVKIENAYLDFVLYVLFHDVCRELSCPRPFNLLLKSEKMSAFLVRRLLRIDLGTSVRCAEDGEATKRRKTAVGHSEEKVNPSVDFIEVLEHLLDVERMSKKTSQVDKPFIRWILSRISEAKRAEMIKNTRITPLSMLMMETVGAGQLSGIHLDVANLLKARSMSYEDGLVHVHRCGVDFKMLRKVFLGSGFREIQKHLRALLDFYPEMMFGAKKLHPERLDVLRNPLCIPVDADVLCAYIPAAVYFAERKLGASRREQNLETLLRMIYIERILSNTPRRRDLKAIHHLILDAPVLVRILVAREFKRSLVGRVVRHVPSFHLAYDLSLKMLCKDPSNQFHLALTRRLLKTYPTAGNVEKLRSCASSLPQALLQDAEHLLTHPH